MTHLLNSIKLWEESLSDWKNSYQFWSAKGKGLYSKQGQARAARGIKRAEEMIALLREREAKEAKQSQ